MGLGWLCVISRAEEAGARAAESEVVELSFDIGRGKGQCRLWMAIHCFVRKGDISGVALCKKNKGASRG